MRLVIIAAAFLAGCGAPQPAPVALRDSATDPAYKQSVAQLAAMDREAEAAFRNGKADDASALIEKGEPIASDVLGVPRPTLEATEAASDLDDLYGRMLLSNQHYEWARLQFQKNFARWKYWKPHTEETARRMAQAEAAIAECDRGIVKGRRTSKSHARVK